MLDGMRKYLGPAVVGVLGGALVLVFVVTGVFSPSTGGRGAGGRDAVATVNGTRIEANQFLREYNARIQYFQEMMKGAKIDNNMLKQLGIAQQIIDDLVRKQLVLQEAKRLGLIVSDIEVRDRVQTLPMFQKNQKFDAATYNGLLSSNGLDAGKFEDMIREEILSQQVLDRIRSRALVSDLEVEREYLGLQDQRQVQYVYFGPEFVKTFARVSDAEIDKKLSSELEKVKEHYEMTKFVYAKKVDAKKVKKSDATPPPEYEAFETVKRKVAADLLQQNTADKALVEARKAVEKFYSGVKAEPTQWAALAKTAGYSVKTSEKFSAQGVSAVELAPFSDLVDDAFRTENAPLANQVKLYESRGSFVVAGFVSASKGDLTGLNETEKKKLSQEILKRKERLVFEQWMDALKKKAKIVIKQDVLKALDV